ncbi:hypothetical protein C1H46_025080 [Malus baccata]|uniref:Gfo/Idh/MocA-like oxidoreductase N-terminal domain-containing protein n=1 Tax=Malus baccata TaxID=106549 RepID=A0A540LSS7_MALBA|nr:hypothetical protein C1H46_025080 [Malus baccata]
MSAKTPIRFRIVGCAEIARKVLWAITRAPNATLYVVGRRSIDKATAFAKANNFLPTFKIYSSYDAVLDDPDVNTISVPLPTSLHIKWAVLAV